MPEENQKSFLQELQSLNEPTKRKVLIIATIIIMAIILYLWLGYFNGLVASVAPAPVADNQVQPQLQTQPQTQAQQASNGSNFFQNLKIGVAAIGNMFQRPRQYNIQPSK